MDAIQKKVCLLGDFAVGKTSLIRRFVEGRFDDRYLSTIGVRISRRRVERPDKTPVSLLIWDLAGGEDFTRLTAGYLRGAEGALLVCDLTRPKTLAALPHYAAALREVVGPVPIILLANKADLDGDRALNEDSLRAMGAQLHAPLLVTSAKTGDNVEEGFALLGEKITTQ